MTMFERREGEEMLALDPATMPADGHVVFIGRVVSPWTKREDCPKNMRAARETGKPATVLIDAPYRSGLRGLQGASHVIVLTWLHHSPRNLIVQKPRHAADAKGVFALRSPVRPNPVGLHVAKLLSLDMGDGALRLEAIDALDGTPVIDIKPYFASVDSVPEATVARSDG
jgi:tRNA-Thr(GGU) m(6)t(6)A37 methyltransferase TsaA